MSAMVKSCLNRCYTAMPVYSRRVTMHFQFCKLFNGEIHNYDLMLYVRDNKQYGKTIGVRPRKHFRKEGNFWVQVKYKPIRRQSG